MGGNLTTPDAGDEILASWAADLITAANQRGTMAWAFPPGYSVTGAGGAGTSLAAVSASNGGAILQGISVPHWMYLRSITIKQGSTANARSAEFRLYYDDGTSTLQFVTGTDGTLSFTPTAISDETAAISTPGTLLLPGFYWFALRNTSASQAFVCRTYTTYMGNYARVITAASVPALGATLGGVTGWSDTTDMYMVRLNGSVMGETTAFP